MIIYCHQGRLYFSTKDFHNLILPFCVRPSWFHLFLFSSQSVKSYSTFSAGLYVLDVFSFLIAHVTFPFYIRIPASNNRVRKTTDIFAILCSHCSYAGMNPACSSSVSGFLAFTMVMHRRSCHPFSSHRSCTCLCLFCVFYAH